jgi:tripartite-type tricarboxylate transporter receptor subunit TctC
MKIKKIAALLAIALTGFSVTATAQTDFPSKPIQLVVGYPAGGNTDSIGRTLSQEARKFLGREVVVVNKLGAGGVVGMMSVADAPPDGYTVGLATSSGFTIAPWLMDVPMDLLERTTALVWLGRPQTGIAVRSDGPIRTVKDLIEQARRNPGKVSIGLQGTGSGASLALQAMALDEKVEFSLVPFKGEAPAVTDLLGGHITAAATSAFSFERFVAAGTLRTIASTNEDRLQFEPNVPTLTEQGFPYNFPVIFYLLGPRGIPAAVAKRLVEGFGQAARTRAYLDETVKNGVMYGNPMSGEALERVLVEERAKTGAMVKRLGLKKS